MCLIDVAVVDNKTENNGYVYIKRNVIFLNLHYPSLKNENILHNDVSYFKSPDCTVRHNDSNKERMISVRTSKRSFTRTLLDKTCLVEWPM